MKITEQKLRHLIREYYRNNPDELINEGIFGGALKGLVRKIPGVGDSIADAHTSSALDELDENLTKMVEKIKDLEKRISKLED